MALSVARSAIRRRDLSKAVPPLEFAARTSPSYVPRQLFRKILRSAKQSRLAPLLARLKRWLRGRPLGPIWLGGIGRTEPVDDGFGFGRGTPVDRYYVENFLSARRADIRGRVLEIGDRAYTTRFGGEAVSQSDVLHVHAANPEATIVGDLSQTGTLPRSTFDCMVITQTLHCIFDIAASVRELAAGLKPGGVALVTLPYITQIDRGEWHDTWFWGIAPAAARQLFADVFGPENVEVTSFGNVYAATAFLQGLAFEEVNRRKLDVMDPAYPVLVTIRAVKPHA
jgi:SAM-dependent methyltransferase